MKLAIPKQLSALKESGERPVSPEGGGGGEKKRRWKKRLTALVVLVVLCGLGWHFLSPGQTAAAASVTYLTAQVERMDVTSSISGSGTLEAANSYSVTTLLEGTILTDTFEEGDQVEEGTVLYTIDSSETDSSLEQAQISLDQAQRSYENQLENQSNLTVTAPVAGQVYSIDVEVGDSVNAGQTVATVRDSSRMTLEVPFAAGDAASFYVGQSATVTLDSTFETLSGTVTKVNGVTQVLSGNVQVRYVTIEVGNPGGLSTSQTASASVGETASIQGGTFQYHSEKTVTAKVSGEVSSIPVSEGAQVSQGQALVILTSDDVNDSLQSASEGVRNAQLSLENQYDRLEDYTITSPIAGTIVDKNYKAGETSEANQVLCTIYDLSYLTMTLSVDELDISDIQVGQTVTVTADAVEGKAYEGVVTKVSVAGTSSGSATTYPVTIRIDETEGLLPGMSVDAVIELSGAQDVLAIPSAALNRGNTVLVTADSPSAVDGTLVESEDGSGTDYYSVEVSIGVSGDDYIEITSGLQEGDTVAYLPSASSSGEMMGMMPGMGGGMPSMGGGMPGGGGMPSGGGPGF